MINEPSFVLAEGVASAEEIDTGMQLGAIHPIGTAHARGPDRLDVCRVVNGVLGEASRRPKQRPCRSFDAQPSGGSVGTRSHPPGHALTYG
jgi:3-hydroxybutyryl-CoA dehydrogenase